MEQVTIDALDNAVGPAAVTRRLTGPLGATDVAVNYYELAPGDAFGYAYHRHDDQEEVFVVQAGTATFETETGPVAVGPGEAIRFGPGEFQRGVNEGEERVRAIAIGAPHTSGGAEKLRACPTCGERTPQTLEWAADRDARYTKCLECGSLTARFAHGEVELDPA